MLSCLPLAVDVRWVPYLHHRDLFQEFLAVPGLGDSDQVLDVIVRDLVDLATGRLCEGGSFPLPLLQVHRPLPACVHLSVCIFLSREREKDADTHAASANRGVADAEAGKQTRGGRSRRTKWKFIYTTERSEIK